MFHLLKLAVYAAIGYCVYEFIRGFSGGQTGISEMASRAGRSVSRELHHALDSGAGRVNMSGPGRGERVMSEESGGTSVPHRVGRGVVGQ